MKSRTILVLLLVIGVAVSVFWWMQGSAVSPTTSGTIMTNADSTTSAPNDFNTLKSASALATATSSAPGSKATASSLARAIPPPSLSAVASRPAITAGLASVAINSEANAQNGLQTAKAKGLNLLSGPDGGRALVAAYVQGLTTLPSYAKILGDPSQVQVEPTAIPFYTRDPSDLPSGGGWESATLDGFVYIVDASGQPVMTEEIKTSDPSFAVNAQNTRPVANADARATDLSAALAYLATNDQVQNGSYDVRLVTGMIWLKSNANGPDLFIKLSNGPRTWQANTLYTMDDYQKMVQQYNAQRTTNTGG